MKGGRTALTTALTYGAHDGAHDAPHDGAYGGLHNVGAHNSPQYGETMTGLLTHAGRWQQAAVVVCSLLVLTSSGTLHAQDPGIPRSADSTVPADLKPLLAPRRSELRLVVIRYNADRNLLSGNYAGLTSGGRGGPGPGNPALPGAAAARPVDSVPAPVVAVSPARIARLKRFDIAWQTAVAALDASTLTAAARTDLDSLRATIRINLAELDSATRTLGNVMPLMPFASKLVALVEARIRIEDIDAERAAGTITDVTRDIARIRSRLDSARSSTDPNAAKPSRAQAIHAAAAVETLRSNLGTWFTFYNGYDPLFTWWMGLPYKHVNGALASYAAFLKDSVAVRNPSSIASAALSINPAAPPKYGDVPNLAEIIALPQDEMSDIVTRFLGRGQGGRGGGRGAGAPAAAAPPRDSTFYRAWLGALKSLDFDKLSRNAQVDYLYLKKIAEQQLAREGRTVPPNSPRKADNSGIPGPARGREGLIRDLQDELIPYTPEQLIALAEREFAWSEDEMRKAAREMGLGNDWKAALEKTKTMHPPPGGQPAMIRDLIHQAIDYLREHDLVTVPTAASESQRMIMMSPQRQIVNPFFTGGAQISVSYPTDSMEYDARQQAMRGNNRPWSHATAHHEMIPGHNLVGYYSQRYAGLRANLGATGPFFGEGWPLYWELTLYDKGFNVTPEERVGALFWRMHRCARIIFSLRFHMGQWSPQESVDFLVDRVGHERENAIAEVRRSFQGGYSPLYQAAYLLGGLQLRGLRREVVDTKRMTEKAFHDEILRQGSMPISLLKLALSKDRLTRDMSIDWKFYGELPDR